MTTDDTIAFAELLDGTCALLSGGKYKPNDTSTAIFFRSLAGYPFEAVRAAFGEHVRRSRFSPTPADILDLLRTADGRPGPEEAWSQALRLRDEAETVVWTPEMAAAWGAAAPLLSMGDEVGARMAFKEVYTARLDEARMAGRPVEWQVMLGHDPSRRELAIQRAMAEGKTLIGGAIELRLPAPRGAALALPVPGDAPETPAAVAGREALRALAERMRERTEAIVSDDATAKAATAAARAATATRVEAYQNGSA